MSSSVFLHFKAIVHDKAIKHEDAIIEGDAIIQIGTNPVTDDAWLWDGTDKILWDGTDVMLIGSAAPSGGSHSWFYLGF